MALALLAFWLVLSGHYEPRMLALGVGSVLLVLYLSIRMGVVDEEGVPVHLLARVPVYGLWLTKEIFLASVRVARIILDPRLPIRPGLARYPLRQRTEVGRVSYANSITLTPGTLTVRMEGEELEVHSLTRPEAGGPADDPMSRWVCWLEQGGER